MATITVSRNPLDRTELERDSLPGKGRDCAFCGQTKRTMYRYRVIADSLFGRRGAWSRTVCDLSCYDLFGYHR